MVLQPNESLNLKHSLQRLTIPESVSNFKPPLLSLLGCRYRSTCSISEREILLRPLPPPKKANHPFMCSCTTRAFAICINTATNFDLLVHKITIYPFSPFSFQPILQPSLKIHDHFNLYLYSIVSTLKSKMARQKNPESSGSIVEVD